MEKKLGLVSIEEFDENKTYICIGRYVVYLCGANAKELFSAISGHSTLSGWETDDAGTYQLNCQNQTVVVSQVDAVIGQQTYSVTKV